MNINPKHDKTKHTKAVGIHERTQATIRTSLKRHPGNIVNK